MAIIDTGSWGMEIVHRIWDKLDLSKLITKIQILRSGSMGSGVGILMLWYLINGSVMGGGNISLEHSAMRLNKLYTHGCPESSPFLFLGMKD